MNEPGSPSAGAARLQRLAAYLREDPDNVALLADACETAIACGSFDEAQSYLERADGLAVDPDEWAFRRARLCIARRDLDQARSILEGLRLTAGDQPGILHDLAYVALLQGGFARARDLVQPWLHPDRAGGPEMAEALQLLWLRASHRLGLLGEAWAWVREQEAQGTLQPAASGAAGLIAVDLSDFAAALRLSVAALAQRPDQLEALVARGCFALALGDTAEANRLLERALQSNPDDGRTWSALGLASLRAGDLALAQARLERATATLDDHVGTWHALGWARLLQGDREGALKAFRRALDLDRNFAESHGGVGLLLALRGEAEEAERHLAIADRLDPHNVTGRYARALLAGEAGDAQRLQALAARLLDRPGFFGGKLRDALVPRPRPPR